MGPTPSEGALHGLATLRGQTVDQARDALGQAERSYHEAERAHEAAVRARGAQGRALFAARAEFAQAGSVFALRLAEARISTFQGRLAHADQDVARASERLRIRAVERASRQAELRTAELARRAVARTVEQRAAAVSLRTERRLEDEADDHFRAAEGLRARPVSSIS